MIEGRNFAKNANKNILRIFRFALVACLAHAAATATALESTTTAPDPCGVLLCGLTAQQSSLLCG